MSAPGIPVHNQAVIDALPPMLGKPMPGSGEQADPAFLWERAYRDALRALRSIPDPRVFAASIDEHHREALRTAWRGCAGWRVQPEFVRELRILGLVEAGGADGNAESRNHLTAFGTAVRGVVMSFDDAQDERGDD